LRVLLRPTVAADLPHLRHLIGERLPHRIQAITAEIPCSDEANSLFRGRIIGIGGIGFRPDGTVIAFVAMGDEARKYPAAIHRAGLMAMAMIRLSGAPLVIAEPQPNNPTAERWLMRLGFEPADISGQRFFIWERKVAMTKSEADARTG
jgi:hypothetical protein